MYIHIVFLECKKDSVNSKSFQLNECYNIIGIPEDPWRGSQPLLVDDRVFVSKEERVNRGDLP